VSDGPARVELASAREVTALVAMAKTDGAVVREHADRVGLTPAQASRLREHLEGGESLAEGIESVLRAPANDERMLVMA
jgi:hypothetical protein